MKRYFVIMLWMMLCLIASGCVDRSPKINLAEKDFIVEVNDPNFQLVNLSPYIEAIDHQKKPISFADLTIMGDYDLSTVGNYELVITATSEKSSTSEKIELHVVDTTRPEFGYIDTEIIVWRGTTFDPDPTMNLIFAYDNYDKDVTDRITYDGEVDASKEGTYLVDYEVNDTSGNTNAITVTYRVTDSREEFVDYIYKRTIDFYWGKYFIIDHDWSILNYDDAVYYMFTNNGQDQFERACGLRDNHDNTQSGIMLEKLDDKIFMYPQDRVIVNNYLNTTLTLAYRRGINMYFYAVAHYSNGITSVLDIEGLFYLKRVQGKWYVEEFALPN
ncbi:MAG: DUF5011 domain-containing protein [Erysipelotrichaceae bacterium]|nr:DUF5011 domain-containing protein [Erysipelotrichaceae bacterium]MDD3924162.1 DUF5011 domain-containing protein [Erysipelotrichaceae bacterium]MDD4642401.1 DUF5011 domain-containing protein [Erysipelotrichaceae bacterium]